MSGDAGTTFKPPADCGIVLIMYTFNQSWLGSVGSEGGGGSATLMWVRVMTESTSRCDHGAANTTRVGVSSEANPVRGD